MTFKISFSISLNKSSISTRIFLVFSNGSENFPPISDILSQLEPKNELPPCLYTMKSSNKRRIAVRAAMNHPIGPDFMIANNPSKPAPANFEPSSILSNKSTTTSFAFIRIVITFPPILRICDNILASLSIAFGILSSKNLLISFRFSFTPTN